MLFSGILDLGFWISNPQSAFRNPQSPLSLTLLMLRIVANHAHDAFPVNDLAFIADLFY